MPLPLSRTQIDRLGARLRERAEPADLEMLQELLLAHAEPLRAVAAELASVGLHPTTRLKTWPTIVEKLQRESSMGLKGMRDLAGARVVVGLTLLEQETALSTVLGIWPDARVIDRREQPMHGYRAVHVVPRVDGCFVEVQIRTGLQNVWAQLFEALADGWGRQIRYGLPPDDPEAPADNLTGTTPSEKVTRADMVTYIRDGLSWSIAQWERLEQAEVLRALALSLVELNPDNPVAQSLLSTDVADVDIRQAKTDLEAFLEPFISRANQIAAGS